MGIRTTTNTSRPARGGAIRLITLIAGLPLLLGATAAGTGPDRTGPFDARAGDPQMRPIDTSWRTLLGLDYRTGEISEELEDRRGQVVRIPGGQRRLQPGRLRPHPR